MIKSKLKKLINFFGYNIHKTNKEIVNQNFDEILKKKYQIIQQYLM